MFDRLNDLFKWIKVTEQWHTTQHIATLVYNSMRMKIIRNRQGIKMILVEDTEIISRVKHRVTAAPHINWRYAYLNTVVCSESVPTFWHDRAIISAFSPQLHWHRRLLLETPEFSVLNYIYWLSICVVTRWYSRLINEYSKSETKSEKNSSYRKIYYETLKWIY